MDQICFKKRIYNHKQCPSDPQSSLPISQLLFFFSVEQGPDIADKISMVGPLSACIGLFWIVFTAWGNALHMHFSTSLLDPEYTPLAMFSSLLSPHLLHMLSSHNSQQENTIPHCEYPEHQFCPTSY
jgi:hypothetical protein